MFLQQRYFSEYSEEIFYIKFTIQLCNVHLYLEQYSMKYDCTLKQEYITFLYCICVSRLQCLNLQSAKSHLINVPFIYHIWHRWFQYNFLYCLTKPLFLQSNYVDIVFYTFLVEYYVHTFVDNVHSPGHVLEWAAK